MLNSEKTAVITIGNKLLKKKKNHKRELMPSFTHSQVVPNLYDFFLLLNTREDILKNVGD